MRIRPFTTVLLFTLSVSLYTQTFIAQTLPVMRNAKAKTTENHVKTKKSVNNNEPKINSIIGLWKFILTWPDAPNLIPVYGKMILEFDKNKTLKGQILSDSKQRLTINDKFEQAKLVNNNLSFTVQTSVPEIIQTYTLEIKSKNFIKGIVKNSATKPTNRPASWDIPAEIVLSR